MAVSLTIGGINLNDKATYWLAGLDLGANDRDEFWLAPPIVGVAPILMNYVDKAVKMSVTLRLKAASVAALRTAVESVRNQLVTKNVNTSKGGDNFITYNDGTTSKDYVTYASAIAPVDLSANSGGASMLYLVTGQFVIPTWTFQVWRQPWANQDAGAARTPVM